jgi:hypothetical protein
MRNRFSAVMAVIAFLLVLCARATGPDLGEKDQCVRIELQRLAVLYDLLDAFAGKIWPGWDNYAGIEFQAMFPNRAHMIVNPRGEPAEEYKIVEGSTVRGKKVFLNRANEIPLDMKPPLGRGGNARGGMVYINLEVLEKAPEPGTFRGENAVERLDFQSDAQILTYVHELFHEYQTIVWPIKAEQMKKEEKYRERLARAKSVPAKPRRLSRSDMPPIPSIPHAFAVYKDIEGRALMSAFGAKDDREAIEFLKDAFVARELRRKNMPEAEIVREKATTVAEGTAQYAEVKMAQQIRDAGYSPSRGEGEDPYFFKFRFMDEYFRHEMGALMEEYAARTDDPRGFQYLFGMFQCFILDRLSPGWKTGFFENSRTFDDVVAGILGLDEPQKLEIGARLQTKYPYDEISAKHGRVLKEWEDALALVGSREGKKFVVDWTETKVIFPEIVPRGSFVKIFYTRIYPRGVERMSFGEVELVGRETPMEKPWNYYLEWVDVAAGEKGYTLTFESKDGDVYRGAVLTTAGFVLKAPEIRIDEKTDEVWIEVLSQVGLEAKK